jgi:hypothetical protein
MKPATLLSLLSLLPGMASATESKGTSEPGANTKVVVFKSLPNRIGSLAKAHQRISQLLRKGMPNGSQALTEKALLRELGSTVVDLRAGDDAARGRAHGVTRFQTVGHDHGVTRIQTFHVPVVDQPTLSVAQQEQLKLNLTDYLVGNHPAEQSAIRKIKIPEGRELLIDYRTK